MIRWLLAAIALAFAAPAMAAEPVNSYPPPGMMENACPASRDGLWALDPKVLQSDWAWQCRYRADNAKVDPANPPVPQAAAERHAGSFVRSEGQVHCGGV